MAECLSWALSCTSPRCDGGSFPARGLPVAFAAARRRCRGTESSLFTRGIVPGRSVGQRVANIRTAGLRSSPYAGPLQAFLAEASQRVRPVFHGPLTYASTPFEVVDWSLFDVIGVDHYRNSKVEVHRYAETIGRYLDQDKPVVNSEFGHSPYRGDRPSHMEFGEVDTGSLALHRIPLAGRLVRTRLKKGSHLRDGGWLQSRQR